LPLLKAETKLFLRTFKGTTMNRLDAHPMYSVREAITKLTEAYLNSYKTSAENNPITEGERKAINAHLDSLNQLFNDYQQRVKK
jgi:hypothetical protein